MDSRSGWITGNDLWEFFTQDLAIVGDLHSPMLSWIGMAGILALCGWHTAVLLHRVWRIRQVLCRVQSQVSNLLLVRKQGSKEWIAMPTTVTKRIRPDDSHESRRDLDDLYTLDQVMRSAPAFAADWLSYRKTFAVEQSAWFLEPTVSAQKSAAEFFSFETCMAEYINVGFYRQLPSFLTGMGLLFTFLAILIGLSKLHATGSQILGISGLINGLSGKFVTSIAGLACANGFSLLETSVWHRLGTQYRRCLSLLDDIFPQRIVDQHALSAGGATGYASTIVTTAHINGDKQAAEIVHQRLGTAVAALTKASESLAVLSESQRDSPGGSLPEEVGYEVQQALKRAVQPLVDAIQDLNRTMKGQSLPVQLSKSEMETIFQKLKVHGAAVHNTPSVTAEDSGNHTLRPE